METIQNLFQSPNVLLFGILGLLILFVILKIFKWPLKILINGIVGVILLYLVNYIGALVGYPDLVGINWITALIAGILGIPGVAVLVIFNLFM